MIKNVVFESDGTLSHLDVDDGALVEEGERIAEVECMKTYWPLVAAIAGSVRFRLKLGEFVGHGDVVATVESE